MCIYWHQGYIPRTQPGSQRLLLGNEGGLLAHVIWTRCRALICSSRQMIIGKQKVKISWYFLVLFARSAIPGGVDNIKKEELVSIPLLLHILNLVWGYFNGFKTLNIWKCLGKHQLSRNAWQLARVHIWLVCQVHCTNESQLLMLYECWNSSYF